MSNNKIYISNLNKIVTETLLKNHFAEYGEITEIHLPRDKKSQETKGYAFITFAEGSTALNALEQNGKPFLEKEIIVEIAKEKPAKK